MIKELVQVLKSYFHSRKIKSKHWDIIRIEIESKTEFNIVLRNVGFMIGKNGFRINDLETYFSDYYKTPITINAIQHIEWYNK